MNIISNYIYIILNIYIYITFLKTTPILIILRLKFFHVVADLKSLWPEERSIKMICSNCCSYFKLYNFLKTFVFLRVSYFLSANLIEFFVLFNFVFVLLGLLFMSMCTYATSVKDTVPLWYKHVYHTFTIS